MTSSMPPSGSQPEPEYLEERGGAPLAREPRTGGGGRRKAVLAGAGVLGLAVVGGGLWAAASFFATGAQPAEALPASTLGYASIDLDPSGGQKVEAFRTLNKFPAFNDTVGLDADDDVKKWIFDRFSAEAPCQGLDYEDDIAPWLGDRAAVAAVDSGEKVPTFAVAVQVTDAEAAEEGLRTLRECGGGQEGGWAIDGEWALIAETDAIADDLVAEAAEGSLADDETFQRWTAEAGDAGVVNVYAAPQAGELAAENLTELMDPFGAMAGTSSAEPGVPDGFATALEDFEGMAIAVRFDDGAVEIESVGAAGVFPQAFYGTGSSAGDDVLSTLPEDTALAVGLGFEDGWFSKVLDQVVTYSGGQMTVEELLAEAEAETGLQLPEDAETLAGESAALALSSDFDLETFFNSGDGSAIPVAVKVKGDPEEIDGVLEKLRSELSESERGMVGSDSDGDMIAIGPNSDYRSQILAQGDLGGTDAFSNVVREAGDAGAIVFVNFDAGDDWLSSLAEGDPEMRANLEPLEGFGVSVWEDGDISHAAARLTTN